MIERGTQTKQYGEKVSVRSVEFNVGPISDAGHAEDSYGSYDADVEGMVRAAGWT